MKAVVSLVIALATAVIVNAQDPDDEGSGPDVADVEIAAEDGEETEPWIPVDRSVRVTWTTSASYGFERRAGFKTVDSTHFHGPPVAFRSRMRAKVGDHAALVAVVDHDAGEGMGSAGRIFDFASGSLTVSDLGPVREVVVGSLRPRFGFGLSVWGGQRMARPVSSPSSFLRASASVRAGGSASEALSLHGIGVDLALGSHFRLVGFAARTSRDAVIDDSGSVTSLPTSGLHRNDRERSTDDRLAGRMGAAALEFLSRRLAAGILVAAASTHRPIAAGSRPFQRYRFSGDRWRGASVYVNAEMWQRLRLTGEAAIDRDGSAAVLAVARIRVSNGLALYGSYRDYPPVFNSVYGTLPGASSSGLGNEVGGAVGLDVSIGSSRVVLFRDLHRRPWLQADSYRPSTESSWGIHAEGDVHGFRVLVRQNARVTNRETVAGRAVPAPFSLRNRLRVRVTYNGDGALRPGLDVVLVRFRDTERESGQAFGQRLVWIPRSTVRLTAGVVFFGSDSGDSGVYLYEADMPDYFSVPLLSSAGQRAYLLLSLEISRTISTWVKGAVTRYEVERTIGSGVDRLTTSQLRAVSFAIRIRT